MLLHVGVEVWRNSLRPRFPIVFLVEVLAFLRAISSNHCPPYLGINRHQLWFQIVNSQEQLKYLISVHLTKFDSILVS